MAYTYGSYVDISGQYCKYRAGIALSSTAGSTSVSVSGTGVCNWAYYSGYKPTYITIKRVINGTTTTIKSWSGNCTGNGSAASTDGTPTVTFTDTLTKGTSAYTAYYYCYVHTADISTDSVATLSVPVPVGYTACQAPTVSISPATVGPAGTYTISWSGAKAGTNNDITGYVIELNDTAQSKISSTATSGSKSFTASTTGGSTYRARVKTIGTVSGYDSSYSGYTDYATVFGVKFNGSWVGPLYCNGIKIEHLYFNNTQLY